MSAVPKISVVLGAFNAQDFIQEAVDSILSQGFTGFELIIVNDGSDDGTSGILDAIHDDRVRIITNPQNIGLTKSLNIAIAEARGRMIARQDADDVSLPDRLQRQFDFLQDHPDIHLLGTARATLLTDGTVSRAASQPVEFPTFDDLLAKNCFVHGSVMIRREALEKIGTYNELFRYTQDYELWLRLAKHFATANLLDPFYAVRWHTHRVTLNKTPAAVLYRLLARNIALDRVRPGVMEIVRERGIEAYYEELPKGDRIFCHQRMKRKYMKHGLNRKALEQCRELSQLQPLNPSNRWDTARLKLRTIFSREQR